MLHVIWSLFEKKGHCTKQKVNANFVKEIYFTVFRYWHHEYLNLWCNIHVIVMYCSFGDGHNGAQFQGETQSRWSSCYLIPYKTKTIFEDKYVFHWNQSTIVVFICLFLHTKILLPGIASVVILFCWIHLQQRNFFRVLH